MTGKSHAGFFLWHVLLKGVIYDKFFKKSKCLWRQCIFAAIPDAGWPSDNLAELIPFIPRSESFFSVMQPAPVSFIDTFPAGSAELVAVLRNQPLCSSMAFLDEAHCAATPLPDGQVVIVYAGSAAEALAFAGRHAGLTNSRPVLFCLDRADVDETVHLMRFGANAVIVRPFDPEKLAVALTETGAFNEEEVAASGIAGIIGASERMREVFSLIRKVADADTTVLVQGESGTGKELIAKALHTEGRRAGNPFVPVNCGAIPAELLESELFGHEKGAFTHAINTRIGRFELANGGTVFLDEVSEMSPMLQVKILRALQERQFERIGGTRTISSDFRVIAATNRNLEEEVEQGRFREDLYYRLNVIQINAPPLRERPTDIPVLAEHFIARFDRLKKKTIRGISEQAFDILLRYRWPGNVRELENVIERMVILSSGSIIDIDDLPEKMQQKTMQVQPVAPAAIPAEGYSLSDEMATYEKRLIIQALNQTDWVKNRAAGLLGVNRTTLIEKMKRYNLVKPQVKLEG